MNKESKALESVWYVDDDPDDISIFTQALSEIAPAISFKSFSNAEALLETLKTSRPDLLLLDLNMPRVSGIDCIKAIREMAANFYLPLIVYSGSPNAMDVANSYNLGADLYIRKPITYSDLVSTVSSIIRMDWNNPAAIKMAQFNNGSYQAFSSS